MRSRGLVGAFVVLLAVVVLASAMTWLQRPSGLTFHARLPEAPGLHEGARVFFRGIEVGGVERIGFDSGGVRLTIAMRRRDVPLRSGDRVRVTSDPMFGGERVDIVPGPPTAPPLASGETLLAAPPDSVALRLRAAASVMVDHLMGDIIRTGRDSTAPAGRR